MLLRSRLAVCFALIGGLMLTFVGVHSVAQDKKKTGQPKADTKKKAKPKTGAAAVAEWKKLDAERKAIGKELRTLRIEFRIATRKRKLEIQKIFEMKIAKWNDIIRPKMIDVALAQLEHEPDTPLAAKLARRIEDFQQVAAVTDRILKKGSEAGPVLDLAGLTQFKLNHFKRSVDLLTKARDKNALSSQLLFDAAKDYVKYWETEQELRKKEAAAKGDERLPRVKIATDKGDVVVELFENEAPNTVANFISLVEKKHYDGQRIYAESRQSFDRLTSGFTRVPMLLIGDEDTKKDFDPKKIYGTLIPVYTIKSEAFESNARMHFRGSLSMIATGRDEGYCDFGILKQPFPGRNAQPGGFGGKTVFGRVVSGMDVVDKLKKGDLIKSMTVLFKRKHDYKPKTSLDEKKKPKSKDGKTTPKKTGDGKTTPKKTPDKKKPESKTKTPAPNKTGAKTKTPAKTGKQ